MVKTVSNNDVSQTPSWPKANLAEAALLLAFLGFVPAIASAQNSFTGTVTDTSGAVLPGVTVTAASPMETNSLAQ